MNIREYTDEERTAVLKENAKSARQTIRNLFVNVYNRSIQAQKKHINTLEPKVDES